MPKAKHVPQTNTAPPPEPTPLVVALDAVDRWNELWRTGVSTLWTAEDSRVLERLVEAEATYRRVAARAAEGQPSNVTLNELAKARTAVARLEGRLMLSRDTLRRQGYRLAAVEAPADVPTVTIERPSSVADDQHPAGLVEVEAPWHRLGLTEDEYRARMQDIERRLKEADQW